MSRLIKFRFWTGKRMLKDAPSNIVAEGGSLMQLTGLKDKNGVEIYEGDIVKASNETFIIKHWMGNFCMCSGSDATGFPIYPYNVTGIVEVIGNIHENPELLEAK